MQTQLGVCGQPRIHSKNQVQKQKQSKRTFYKSSMGEFPKIFHSSYLKAVPLEREPLGQNMGLSFVLQSVSGLVALCAKGHFAF